MITPTLTNHIETHVPTPHFVFSQQLFVSLTHSLLPLSRMVVLLDQVPRALAHHVDGGHRPGLNHVGHRARVGHAQALDAAADPEALVQHAERVLSRSHLGRARGVPAVEGVAAADPAVQGRVRVVHQAVRGERLLVYMGGRDAACMV